MEKDTVSEKLPFVLPADAPLFHQEFVAQLQGKKWELRWYSGRGMYGKQVPAISCEPFERDLVTHISGCQLDSDTLGLRIIVWPVALIDAYEPDGEDWDDWDEYEEGDDDSYSDYYRDGD